MPPGSIFTWEGGKGACLSVPIDGAAIDFSARQTRRDQIMERLKRASGYLNFAKNQEIKIGRFHGDFLRV
jgi:hypothetical protein